MSACGARPLLYAQGWEAGKEGLGGGGRRGSGRGLRVPEEAAAGDGQVIRPQGGRGCGGAGGGRKGCPGAAGATPGRGPMEQDPAASQQAGDHSDPRMLRRTEPSGEGEWLVDGGGRGAEGPSDHL